MEDTRTSLGARLKQARQEAQLKQEQAARYLRVTPSAISGIESGQRKVDALELFYLSKLYNKPLDWFFAPQQDLNTNPNSPWFDQDPLIREILFLLEKASPDLRRRAAYGVLGFLSDR